MDNSLPSPSTPRYDLEINNPIRIAPNGVHGHLFTKAENRNSPAAIVQLNAKYDMMAIEIGASSIVIPISEFLSVLQQLTQASMERSNV